MSRNQLEIDIQGDAALAWLLGAQTKMHDYVLRAVTRLSIQLQAVVIRKLTGQVLHARTGNLRRSINRVVRDAPGEIVGQVGTNVAYAAIHEYGFDGVENVREYVRRRFAPSSMALAGRKHGDIRTWVKKRGEQTGEVTVRAHTRHMVMPERSFLRSSLGEMSDDIRQQIKTAAHEALIP